MAAVVAGRAAIDRLRCRRRAPVDHGPVGEFLAHRRAEYGLGTSERHRLQKVAVGVVLEMIRMAAHADHLFDAGVVRLDLLVRNRPVIAVAVVSRRLEIARAEPQRHQPPVQGLAAHGARPHPDEPLPRVRVIELVDEARLVPFVDYVVVFGALPWANPATEGKLVGPLVVLKGGCLIEFRSGLKQQNFQSLQA